MISDQKAPQDPSAPAGDEPSATDKVVAAFGGIRPMAQKLDMPVTTVQGWKKRGVIPPQRHDAIRAAARDHGVALDESMLTETATTSGPETASAAGPAVAAKASTGQGGSVPRSKRPTTTTDSPSPQDRAARTTGPTPPPRQRSGPAWMALFVALIALVAVATAPFWTGPLYRIAGQPVATSSIAAIDITRLDALEDRLAALERSVEANTRNRGSSSATSALTSQFQAMERRLAALEQAATPELAGRVAAIGGAIDALAADVARLDGALGNQRIGLAEARALVTGLEEGAVQVEQQLAEISTTQSRDGRRIDRLVSSDSATQALILAIGQLRTGIDTGQPYTQPLAALRALAAGIDETEGDLAALMPRAAIGIPDRDTLKTGFPAMAQSVREAVLLPPDAGWMTQAVARIEGLVTVRPAPGEVDGDDVAAVLARAEGRLDQGNLTGAVDALALLEGEAAAAAAIWTGSAVARLDAEKALGNLNNFVIARLADNASDADTP